MAIALHIELHGGEAFNRAWARVGQFFGKDLTPFFEIITKWWYAGQAKIFATEGKNLLGSRWAPLGALTESGPPGQYGEWKQKHYPGKPLLQLTGRLMSAMTRKTSYSWQAMTPESLQIGLMNIPYWKAMNYGRRDVNIPDRKFVGIAQQEVRQLDKAMQEKLTELNRILNEEAGAMDLGAIGGRMAR